MIHFCLYAGRDICTLGMFQKLYGERDVKKPVIILGRWGLEGELVCQLVHIVSGKLQKG